MVTIVCCSTLVATVCAARPAAPCPSAACYAGILSGLCVISAFINRGGEPVSTLEQPNHSGPSLIYCHSILRLQLSPILKILLPTIN